MKIIKYLLIITLFFFAGAKVYAADFYYNAAVDTTWDEVGNWWTGSDYTTPAGAIPAESDTVYIDAEMIAGPSTPVTLGAIIVGFVSPGSYGVVLDNTTGDATFYGQVVNAGTVTGNISFADSAFTDFSLGTVTGSVTFSNSVVFTQDSDDWTYDTTDWSSPGNLEWIFNGTTINSGVVRGVTFNDNSVNNGSIIGSATIFNDSSHNESAIDCSMAECVFNDSAYNNSSITNNAIFNNDSYNAGSVGGTATFTRTSFTDFDPGTFSSLSFTNAVTFTQDSIDWTYDTSAWNFDEGAGWIFNNDTNHSGGTLVGDVVFNDSSSNSADINGNATFNDSATQDSAIIYGDVIFFEDSSEFVGAMHVDGDKIRHYTSSAVVTRDFVSTGPWTVIADGAGVEVNVVDATYDETTTFVEQNGGDFVYPITEGTLYWYSEESTDWENLSNWWTDAEHTIQAGALPSGTDNVITITGAVEPIVDLDSWVEPSSLDVSSTGITFTSDSNNSLSVSVTGDVSFTETAINDATIDGSATFYEDTTEDTGSVTGTKTRKYTSSAVVTRDFVSTGPWTVIADGAGVEVNVVDATYDETTTFVEQNGGDFVYPITEGTLYWYSSTSTNWNSVSNWWTDSGHTVQSTSVPGASNDVVILNSSSTPTVNLDSWVYPSSIDSSDSIINFIATANVSMTLDIVGNASFNTYVTNEAEISGDAIFYNSSIDSGDVLGTKTRYFNDHYNIVSQFDYVTDGWDEIVADGVTADLTNTLIDNSITLTTLNNGRLVGSDGVQIVMYKFEEDTNIYIVYGYPNSNSSIPDPEDFTVYVDGAVVPVSSVSTTNGLHLVMPASLSDNDVLVSYTPGVNPIKTNTDIVRKAFSNKIAYGRYMVERSPFYPIVFGKDIYIGNETTGSVSVIDSVTHDVITVATTSLVSVRPAHPEFGFVYGARVYFLADNGLFGIDTTNLEYVSRVSDVSGSDRNGLIVLGNKAYIAEDENDQVAVVNLDSNSLLTKINVGDAPFYISSVGTKVYSLNRDAGTVSVIDSLSDTVSDTINVGSAPFFARNVGNKLYITNRDSDTVSVVNTETDSVIETINVSDSPLYMAVLGTKVYVGGSSSTTAAISVIDSDSDTVSTTIPMVPQPYDITVMGDKIIVANAPLYNLTEKKYNPISVIDSNTDTVVAEMGLEYAVYFLTTYDNTIYVTQNESALFTLPPGFYSSVSAVNSRVLPYNLPYLESFTTSATSGTYTTGQNILITANFNRELEPDSDMQVRLSTGDIVILSTVSGRTITGTYTVGAGDETIDLAVTEIISADVSDEFGNHRTEYSLPSSLGDLVAENSKISRNIGDSKDIQIGDFAEITVGDNPYQVSPAITVDDEQYVYVANQGSDDVSVIRLSDYTVVSTIDVGVEPYGLTTVNVGGIYYVYIANTGSDDVSVIDTSSNTVVATVDVGVKPYYVEKVGTKVYVTNSSTNSVSVIDANTNTVTDTISVGNYPRGIKARGTDLYVANYGSESYGGGNSISVIDSNTDEVTDTILYSGNVDGPRGVTFSGDKVYVTNYRSNNVSVINTDTNEIDEVIDVGAGPRGITVTGGYLFVENFDAGTISVINISDYSLEDTIYVGHSPAGMGLVNGDLYISRFTDNKISVLDVDTLSLLSSFGSEPEEDTTAPVISSVASTTSTSTATITWTTDESADSEVNFGTTTSYGTASSSASLVTSHTIILSGLTASTTYHFQISSTDDSENLATSTDYTFTTDVEEVVEEDEEEGEEEESVHHDSSGGGSIAPVVQNGLADLKFILALIKEFFTFNKDLTLHDINPDIKRLQTFLNLQGFVVAPAGQPGSIGHETAYFGPATYNALIKYQISVGLPGSGFFGPKTRAVVNLAFSFGL